MSEYLSHTHTLTQHILSCFRIVLFFGRGMQDCLLIFLVQPHPRLSFVYPSSTPSSLFAEEAYVWRVANKTKQRKARHTSHPHHPQTQTHDSLTALNSSLQQQKTPHSHSHRRTRSMHTHTHSFIFSQFSTHISE